MIKTIGSFTIGEERVAVVIDEYTPIFFASPMETYNFVPSQIMATCLYIRVRSLSGVLREFPINARLDLTGDMARIPESERVVYGEEVYSRSQLTDCMIKFTVNRAGFYSLKVTDKRKNEWLTVADSLFIEGMPSVLYGMSIGAGTPKTWRGSKTKLFFNIYNSKGNVVGVSVPGGSFLVSPISTPQKPENWDELSRGKWYNEALYNEKGFGYVSQGKASMWVDVEADPVSPAGLREIVFVRDDGVSFSSFFFNDVPVPVCEQGFLSGDIAGPRSIIVEAPYTGESRYGINVSGKIKSYYWSIGAITGGVSAVIPSFSTFGTVCLVRYDMTTAEPAASFILNLKTIDGCDNVSKKTLVVKVAKV